MGRKRKKDGIVTSVYLSKDLLRKLEEKKPRKVSISDIVEMMLEVSLKGQSKLLEITTELADIKVQLKDVTMEKDRLERENERLQKKIERLEKENEELKAKWKGQTTLKKYDQKSMEIKAIAERLIEHIEEGKTWREVAKDAGFIFPGDQIDILKKVFQKEGYSFKSEFIPGWKLTESINDMDGYFGYIFKREGDGKTHAITRRAAEVST